MPRYFFHVREGSEVSLDLEGQDLPEFEDARREAVSAIRELIGERILHGGEIDGRQIEIADAAGTVLAVVPSRDVIYPDGHFSVFSDDVTKSAPSPIPSAMKRPAE